jgi:hypothetical protein
VAEWIVQRLSQATISPGCQDHLTVYFGPVIVGSNSRKIWTDACSSPSRSQISRISGVISSPFGRMAQVELFRPYNAFRV